MELRDLTDSEMEDMNHIIYSSDEIDTIQILFGIIALDLNMSVEKQGKIAYQYLCDTYCDSYQNYGPAAFWTILETWISESMIYKNKGLVKDIPRSTKGLNNTINSLVSSLSYSVCRMDNGISGAKSREIIKFFNKTNEDLQKSKGYELDKLPVTTFEFIVTCLDFFDFKRKEKTNNSITVNVENIKYEDLY